MCLCPVPGQWTIKGPWPLAAAAKHQVNQEQVPPLLVEAT